MQFKDYVQDLIDHKEITVGAQTSPNVGLMMYQNAFPPHNTNLGKAPTNPLVNKPNNDPSKQGDNRAKSQNYTSAYLDYGSLIDCISQVEPSINVINIKALDTQCAFTTRRAQLNITGQSVSTPPRPPPSRAPSSGSPPFGP